jgi:hypothetical protein
MKMMVYFRTYIWIEINIIVYTNHYFITSTFLLLIVMHCFEILHKLQVSFDNACNLL